jgi:hypothetical protein
MSPSILIVKQFSIEAVQFPNNEKTMQNHIAHKLSRIPLSKGATQNILTEGKEKLLFIMMMSRETTCFYTILT